MKIVCDGCKKEFTIKKKSIRSEKVFDIVERTFFCCPKCRKKYVISYADKEIKDNIKRLKLIKGKYLRKEVTFEEYEKECRDILERNKSLNTRYKSLYGR